MMAEFTGSILELNEKHAIVMTNTCDFVSIQRQPEMFVGQQIKFKKSYRTSKSYIRYIALVASVFIIALCSVFYFQLFVPSTVFAYIDVDINPSLEFSIDKNAKVLEVKPLNNDAQTLLKDLILVDLPIKEAIAEVVKTSKQLGFISINKKNVVLISASIYEDKDYTPTSSNQKVLDNILSDLGSVTYNADLENIKPEILKVTAKNRKAAIKNDISMGRYELYSEIKNEDKDITVEKAKTERVSDMLDKVKTKGTDKNKPDKKTNPTDTENSKPDNKNNDASQNDIKVKDKQSKNDKSTKTFKSNLKKNDNISENNNKNDKAIKRDKDKNKINNKDGKDNIDDNRKNKDDKNSNKNDR